MEKSTKYQEIDGYNRYLLERKVLRNILRILSEHDKSFSSK